MCFYCYKAATSIHALNTMSQNKTAVDGRLLMPQLAHLDIADVHFFSHVLSFLLN